MHSNLKISEKTLRLLCVEEYRFVVPYMQRSYKWLPENATTLLNDLYHFVAYKNNQPESKKKYFLQTLVVARDGDSWSVVDGQQRLTTLKIIFDELFGGTNQRDYSLKKKNESSKRYEFYKKNVIDAVAKWFDENENRKELLKKIFIEDDFSPIFLWCEIDLAESSEFFRLINTNKIELTNTELIKGLLLHKSGGVSQRDLVASQFAQIDIQLKNDHFWSMFVKGRSEQYSKEYGRRMDYLFNIVEGVSEKCYRDEEKSSFYKLYEKSDCGKNSTVLMNEWKKVYKVFLRLMDAYNDPYIYHYCGFLTYCDCFDSKCLSYITNFDKDKLEDMKEGLSKHCLKETLIKRISEKIKSAGNELEDYRYENGKQPDLKNIFVLYNVETILDNYSKMQKRVGLQYAYEDFPFELLYRFVWNIEHIASQTDNPLDNSATRKNWLEQVIHDFPFLKDEILQEIKNLNCDDEDAFMELRKKIVQAVESDDYGDIPDKDSIGNLALLDEKTNKAMHNDLFAQKRKAVLRASGIMNEEDSNLAYVPPCTRNAFEKAYTKGTHISLLTWSLDDYHGYKADMKKKLDKYFK